MSTSAISATPGAGETARTTVHVNLNQSVDLEAIKTIVAGIGGRYGCRTCGLMGIDLRLSGDPGDFTEIETLPGVNSVALE